MQMKMAAARTPMPTRGDITLISVINKADSFKSFPNRIDHLFATWEWYKTSGLKVIQPAAARHPGSAGERSIAHSDRLVLERDRVLPRLWLYREAAVHPRS